MRAVLNSIGGNPSEASDYTSNSNFLDIIIEKDKDYHASIYLSCKNGNSNHTCSIYSSLMPKGEKADKQGVEGSPKIHRLLLKLADFSMKNSDGSLLYSMTKASNTLLANGERFTFKEVLKTFKFGIFYLIADKLVLDVEGEIISKQPVSDKIRLQKRFYLTPKEAQRAIALINKVSTESLEGKTIYNYLKHNCVDYVKEIYEGIGLNKSQGEFLSQLGLNRDLDYDKLDKKEKPALMMLKAYKIHNDGIIGFKQVILGLWTAIRSFLDI